MPQHFLLAVKRRFLSTADSEKAHDSLQGAMGRHRGVRGPPPTDGQAGKGVPGPPKGAPPGPPGAETGRGVGLFEKRWSKGLKRKKERKKERHGTKQNTGPKEKQKGRTVVNKRGG